jgi:hypothetical protein
MLFDMLRTMRYSRFELCVMCGDSIPLGHHHLRDFVWKREDPQVKCAIVL